MGVPRLKWYNYPQAALIGVVVLFVFVEIGQLVGRLVRFLVRQLNRFAPPRVSFVVVVALLLSLTIAVLNGVVVRGGMSFLNSTFASVNDEMDPDNPAPTTPLRSGGPGSLVTWESLGHQGRVFVSAGPTVEQLTKFNGTPAVEPIRAYAGKNSANNIKATADARRPRAGADRRTSSARSIAVATTTGTGWINEAEASALEYMYNGDTAIVSMQYSFLPSWLSFLVDKENARQAGQALFEAVDARLREMPEAQRPKIVVFGESLGSFGGEAPFLSPNNIIARTDGALFSGPTFNNTMWDDVTVNRDDGSPMWLPIFDDGQNIRFAARPDNLGRPDKPWGYPRIVYLQHASDPITWWNPDLLFSEPDWLREPRGYDVSPRHVLDSDRDVPAGVGGHGGGRRRARRARPPLRARRRQRVGGDPAAAGVDAGEDRSAARDRPTHRSSLEPAASTPASAQRLIAADDVGGPVQTEVQQRQPRPGSRCSPASTAPPIRRRRRRPGAAGRRWSGRSATPGHCVRSPARPARRPSRRAGPADGCRPESRRDAGRRALPWRPVAVAGARAESSTRRCGCHRSLPFGCVGQLGARAAQTCSGR